MIKIIKHGQKEFNRTCGRCGCAFTYEYEDIITNSYGVLAINATVTSMVKCPDCGNTCYINSNDTLYTHKIDGLTLVEPIPCNTSADIALNTCGEHGDSNISTNADLIPIDDQAIRNFKANINTPLAVDTADFDGSTPKAAEIPVAINDAKAQDCCNISASDVISLCNLPEPDLSVNDVITADIPPSSDSYLNSAYLYDT